MQISLGEDQSTSRAAFLSGSSDRKRTSLPFPDAACLGERRILCSPILCCCWYLYDMQTLKGEKEGQEENPPNVNIAVSSQSLLHHTKFPPQHLLPRKCLLISGGPARLGVPWEHSPCLSLPLHPGGQSSARPMVVTTVDADQAFTPCPACPECFICINYLSAHETPQSTPC